MYSFHSKKVLATVSVAALIFYSLSTKLKAHGFVGDRFFPPTITTDDPFAVDELSLPLVTGFGDPSSDGVPPQYEVDLSWEFDKEILPHFALGISNVYSAIHGGGQPSTYGFSDLEA